MNIQDENRLLKIVIIMMILLVALSGCTKEVVDKKMDGSSSIVGTVNNSRVTIKLDPTVICYSYKNGEIPRPCDIWIYATVSISPRLSQHLAIELENGQSSSIIVVGPNTDTITLNTGFQSLNNNYIAPSLRIRKLTPFKLIK